MMNWKSAVGLAMLLVGLTGCLAVASLGAGAAGGTGAYAYVKGSLERIYPHPYDKVWEGSKGALKDLEIQIKREAKDAVTGEIQAERSNGTAVHVSLKFLDQRATSVKVRVGLFGNRRLSERIHEAIASKL